MLKKTVQLLLILTLTISALVVINQNTSLASLSDPVSLKICAYPPNILADNKTYNCIYVQLIDSSGKPARALENTIISLASFDINIGTVDPTLTILKNTTYATASFTATFSPGTAQISASANGYSTVQTSLTTIAPFPCNVAVYGVPSTLPADGGTYSAIMVQLQDSDGTPAIAPRGGVFVALSSSNTTIGTVTPNVTIAEGSTYAIANFTTQLAAGTTTITSVPEMYDSETALITTTPVNSNPTQLNLYVGPNQLLADRSSYRQIVVELQNGKYSAISPTDITVLLSSNDPTIGKVASQITIPAHQSFVVTDFNTTYRAGKTDLTAVADNFGRVQESITTNGFTPAKLMVYCPPLLLPADNGTYPAVVVQLQDLQGRPAKDSEGNVTLKLFSSQLTVASVNSTITIPFGETQAVGDLKVTNSPGTTTITAQASSYATGQATVTTYLIDFLPMHVTGNTSLSEVSNGQNTDVTVHVTADNNTVSGASVSFTSDNGGTFSATSDLGNGNYKTTYTAPSFTQATNCIITANVSKSGYITSQATMQITVSPPPPSPTPTATPSPSPTPTSTPTPTANPNENTNPTQSSENTTGTIQLCIQDYNGNSLSNANVTSTTQPNGTKPLSALSDSSGYVVFKNVTVGQYLFKILKDGYDPQTKAVTLNDNPVNRTYALESQAVSGGGADLTLPIIVVVVVIVAVVVGFVLYKRRGSDEDEYEYEDEPS